MKSKKKKNKVNILIAYNKSIASIQGIELAMLFCHTGFNVNSILLGDAEKHISSELLKEVTSHSPWSDSHKPNWVKSNINYPICVVVEPSEEFQKMVLGDDDDKYSRYIKEHCGFIKILQKEEIASHSHTNDLNKQIIKLPNNPLNLRSLFEKILSETVKYIASKALDGEITYILNGDFSNIDYLQDLGKAFAEAGIKRNWIATPSARNDDNHNCSVVLTKGNKQIEIVLEANEAEINPTENKIYVSKHKNGLLLIDNIETRLMPNFSCQSCFARLVTYLKTELSRN
ncbi:MAG: hypothetical protein J6Z11_09190 [Candidatus Riflebacteria bacterium]|nr:hypothetical protein [Candidatus Riflebacteria bacterium]